MYHHLLSIFSSYPTIILLHLLLISAAVASKNLCNGFRTRQSRVMRVPGFVCGINRRRTVTFSIASNYLDKTEQRPINDVAIIGGGLAGLSTAYHLLELRQHRAPLNITIYDRCKVGEGGASAVAGGLMHPFSPKGKLIHFGLQALEASKHLVQTAIEYDPSCLIQPHLYRVALNDSNVKQLQETAIQYPELATWLSKEAIGEIGADSMGGLRLSNGCQVIHVPLYLKALWNACQEKAEECDGSISWERSQLDNSDTSTIMRQLENDHDAVILAAGSGILKDGLLCNQNDVTLPVQLIRGQSILMNLPQDVGHETKHDALLCGKYISPIPTSTIENQGDDPCNNNNNREFVIGATHEYKEIPLSQEEVFQELKQRSYQLAPRLWDNGVINKLTSGIRMQSNRGKYGRMPIVGKLPSERNNSWIFTGLSSRGLIYHGLFGRWLAEAVLYDDEQILHGNFEEYDWWKRKSKE